MANNDVTIFATMIERIEYVPNSLTVTEGQRKEEPVRIENKGGGYWKIRAVCGRKGSVEIGNRYSKLCRQQNYCPGFPELTGGAGSHGNANLFFSLDLYSKDGGCQTVHLSQAPFPDFLWFMRNYWWIGPASSINYDNNKYAVSGYLELGAKYYELTGSVSEIRIGK